jgi:hypothetical protein
MNITEAENALTAVLATLTDRVVVLSDQSAPAPVGPYLTLKVGGMGNPYDEDTVSSPDDEGIAQVHGHREFTGMLRAFRGSAPRDDLELLRTRLNFSSTRCALRQRGLVLIRSLDMSDVVEAMGGEFEPRAAMDLHLRTYVVAEDDVGRVETVEISSTFT